MVDSLFFIWVVIPLLIFFARILDVSIGTLRIVYISRGQTVLAPILGFFEIVIWLVAMRQIFSHLDNLAYFFAYAAGFSMGNYVGMIIEQKLAVGMQVVRIISQNGTDDLLAGMKRIGLRYTLIEGKGANSTVKLIFTVLKRKDFPLIYELINQHTPKAFFTREDLQDARDSLLPALTQRRHTPLNWRLFKMDRKRK